MYKGGFGMKRSKTDGQCPFFSRKHKQQARASRNLPIMKTLMSFHGECQIGNAKYS